MMIALLGVGVAAWRPAPRPLVGGGPSAAARPSVAFGDPLELANWSPVVAAAPARPPSLAGIAAAATEAAPLERGIIYVQPSYHFASTLLLDMDACCARTWT